MIDKTVRGQSFDDSPKWSLVGKLKKTNGHSRAFPGEKTLAAPFICLISFVL